MQSQDFHDFVEEVIEKNDIAEVISEYVKLKRVGSRYAALCPLHNDKKSPSLSISPDKQLFHCFGCGAGGNVIHFIMAAENLDFTDALKYLANRAHIPIPERGSPADRKKRAELADKKQLIYKINEEAARYFFHNLAGEKGKSAYAYLRERKITNSTIKRFGLGYAPEGWTSLLDFMQKKGYSNRDVYEAGLAKKRDNGTYYDAFYDGRVMFPIINVQGNIIGFGGRIMTEKSNTGKYLNTAETAVFKKKENLFGLNFAKNDKSGRILLMEGYMDVIALHQAGICNAVASLGTAFTPEQAKLLKKYTDKAVLCYDADQAGKKAADRAGVILREHGIKTRVLSITDGKDPDEFIKAKGADMFRVLIEGAKPFIEYKIDELKKNYDTENTADTEQLLEFSEAAAAVLAEIENPVELELYIKRVADTSGISADGLKTRVDNLRRKRQTIQSRAEERQERKAYEERTGGRSDLDRMKLMNAERLLLNLIADDRLMLKKTKDSGIIPKDFSEGLHRELAEKIFTMPDGSGIQELLGSFSAECSGDVAAILLDDKNTTHTDKSIIQPLEIILANKRQKEEKKLLQEDDLAALDKLIKEKRRQNRRN